MVARTVPRERGLPELQSKSTTVSRTQKTQPFSGYISQNPRDSQTLGMFGIAVEKSSQQPTFLSFCGNLGRMLAFPRSALRLTSCGSRLYSAGSVRLAAADVGAIKKLREMSGAPMMDCKNALSSPDVQGDLQKALAWLRAKGISKMAQSTRATTEGLIGIHTDSNKGTVALVEINCETGKTKSLNLYVLSSMIR